MGYISINGKYYQDDLEITKQEYDRGILSIKQANGITQRIRAGETVEIPEELQELVTAQLTAWEEYDREVTNEPTESEYAETGRILIGD